MKTRKLTNVEMTFLGMAWLRGPCTIYVLMKELAASESTYHRSRAGTAYSVAKRLIEGGFLSQRDSVVAITPLGAAFLKEWLLPPVPTMDIAHTADLLRLRFFFLGTISVEERLEFVDQSLVGLQEFLVRCRALIGENEKIGDYFGALATLNLVLETKARIRWLELVRPLVLEPLEGDWTKSLLDLIDS